MCRIYHYTKIDTLEVIVRNNTFRFNRLDKVDDQEESKFWSGPTKLMTGKYIFISSWTKEKEEISDLWERYGDNHKGVRISMREPFLQSEQHNLFRNFRFFSPDLRKYNDCVFPFICNEAKLHDVQYVSNNEQRILDLVHSEQDLIKIKIKELGIYKNIEPWVCQKECRYKIIAFPFSDDIVSSLDGSGNDMFKLVDNIIESLLRGKRYIKPEYIDIPLLPSALRSIKITMGKNTTKEDKERVLKLLNISSLSNKIFRNRVTNSEFK